MRHCEGHGSCWATLDRKPGQGVPELIIFGVNMKFIVDKRMSQQLINLSSPLSNQGTWSPGAIWIRFLVRLPNKTTQINHLCVAALTYKCSHTIPNWNPCLRTEYGSPIGRKRVYFFLLRRDLMIPMALDDFEGFLDASLAKIKHDPTTSWNLSFIRF